MFSLLFEPVFYICIPTHTVRKPVDDTSQQQRHRSACTQVQDAGWSVPLMFDKLKSMIGMLA